MPWISLGQFKLNNNWTFTQSIEGEIFRIVHQPINNLPVNNLRAVIAQGFIDSSGKPNKFTPKIFTYGEEFEIFTFYFPVGISEHSIIVKRLDKNSIDWIIEVEVFKSNNSSEDYENYLTSRFGREAINQFNQSFVNNMTLTPLLFSGSTTPNSSIRKKLTANNPERIFHANEARTEIRVWSSGQPIMLCNGFDEAGEPLELLSKMPPNYYHHDIISSAGMWKGDIWAVSEAETYIDYVEYSAK